MEQTYAMDTDQAVQDLDRRVTTLEAEHKERWKAQFHLNKDVKQALSDLVTSVTAGRIRTAFYYGLAAAGGGVAGGYLS